MSCMPYVERNTMSNVVGVSPTTGVIQMPPERRNASERSPLIINRRQVRRRAEPEGIINCKIVALLLMLVCGVLIGIHLLVIECKIWWNWFMTTNVWMNFYFRQRVACKFSVPSHRPQRLVPWTSHWQLKPHPSRQLSSLKCCSVSYTRWLLLQLQHVFVRYQRDACKYWIF